MIEQFVPHGDDHSVDVEDLREWARENSPIYSDWRFEATQRYFHLFRNRISCPSRRGSSAYSRCAGGVVLG